MCVCVCVCVSQLLTTSRDSVRGLRFISSRLPLAGGSIAEAPAMLNAAEAKSVRVGKEGLYTVLFFAGV